MKYVSKTMGIYTTSANRAKEIAREILENEEKQNIQVFSATPSQLEGDVGYKVDVSYYEYTDKENYEINLSKTKETIKENLISLHEKVEDTIISSLNKAIDVQVDKINTLCQRRYISGSEASNYLHDLLEIITSITRSILLSYESTNVKILASDNSIVLDYYRTCINIEYSIEKYIQTKDKTYNLIWEVRLKLSRLNNQERYEEISNLVGLYHDIDYKRNKEELSIDESILEMNDCYNKLDSINKSLSSISLQLKKVEE